MSSDTDSPVSTFPIIFNLDRGLRERVADVCMTWRIILVNSLMLFSKDVRRSSMDDDTMPASDQLSCCRSDASGSSQSILASISECHCVPGKSYLRDRHRRQAWLRGSRSHLVLSLRQVLHAVIERRMRLFGRRLPS